MLMLESLIFKKTSIYQTDKYTFISHQDINLAYDHEVILFCFGMPSHMFTSGEMPYSSLHVTCFSVCYGYERPAILT